MWRSDFQFLTNRTQKLCICINVKKMAEGGAFCLFLMDGNVGGGLRLI